MKWEYVPFIGLFVTFSTHWIAVKKYLTRHVDGSENATWEAEDKCMVAIACTFIPALLVGILAIL